MLFYLRTYGGESGERNHRYRRRRERHDGCVGCSWRRRAGGASGKDGALWAQDPHHWQGPLQCDDGQKPRGDPGADPSQSKVYVFEPCGI